MSTEELELKRRELVFGAWKAVVEVQMHFNEMLMRIRNIATALIVAVFGAAALSLQRDLYFRWGHRHVHVAFLIIIFGLVGWVGFGLMDWGYYHRLLVGAVRKSTEIEDLFPDDPILGMTHYITKESRIKLWGTHQIRARDKILFFYILVLLVGVVFAYLVYAHFQPTAQEHAPGEAIGFF